MPTTADSPDGMAFQSHFSLRWTNHQTHILQAFEALRHAEILVDVTLVCADTTFRAHKVVLSACSPLFETIFAEHPCKHSMIVLKDFPGHEVTALIDFMYRGEVRVGREELPGLIRAAENLRVRGLTSSEPRLVSSPETQTSDHLLDAPSMPERLRHSTPIEDDNASENTASSSTRDSMAATVPIFHQRRDHDRSPHMSLLNVGMRELRESCGSPLIPRRKQARPRRRSGELVPQDLSRPHPPASLSPLTSGLKLSPPMSSLNLSPLTSDMNLSPPMSSMDLSPPMSSLNLSPPMSSMDLSPPMSGLNLSRPQQSQQHHHHQQSPILRNQRQHEDIAENLSMKRSMLRSKTDHRQIKVEISETVSSPKGSPLAGTSLLHRDTFFQDIPFTAATASAAAGLSELRLTPNHNEYLASIGQLAAQWFPNHSQSQLPPTLQGHHPWEGSPHRPTTKHLYQQSHQQQQQQQSHQQQQQARQQQQQQQSSLTSRHSSLMPMFPLDGMASLGRGLFPLAGAPDGGSFLADLHDSYKPETLHGVLGAPGPDGNHPGKKPRKYKSDGEQSRKLGENGSRGLPVGKPRGQHSAPRGGPPRSWTNGELTEALQHVWNKKMTTSEASRVFRIPYNSLLMYVRGKYGKSLKLEQLRKDCTGVTTDNVKSVQPPTQMTHPLPGYRIGASL